MTVCRKRFNSILKFARNCAIFVGADIFDPNYRCNLMTWAVIICTQLFFCLSAYTIYVGVYIDKNWTSMLQALCMVGSAIAGLTKLFYGITQRLIHLKLYDKIDEIYRVFEQKGSKYEKALNDATSLIQKVLKYTALLYFLGTVVIVSVPFFYLILYDEKIFVMQFMLVGIDATTDSGHLITIAIHCGYLMMGSFGNFAGDMFFFIFLLQVPMLKDILKLKFEDLNEVALRINDSKHTMPMLVDILQWHQEYSNFTKTVSDVYFGVTFVQILTTSFNIAMTVFITLTGEWPAGYAYLIYSVLILYAYCGLGTITELANDDVCDYVYNTCLWYELSIKEKKMLILMLAKAQTPTLLTVGDIMPLSVTTGLSLTKTIYSFMMMLFNFTEDSI